MCGLMRYWVQQSFEMDLEVSIEKKTDRLLNSTKPGFARTKKWVCLSYLGIPKQRKLRGTREDRREEKGFLTARPWALHVLRGSSLLLMHYKIHVKQPVCLMHFQVCSKIVRFAVCIHVKQINSGFMSNFVNIRCYDPQIGESNLRCWSKNSFWSDQIRLFMIIWWFETSHYM